MVIETPIIRAAKARAPEVRAISGVAGEATIQAATAGSGKGARVRIRAYNGGAMNLNGFDLPVVIDLATMVHNSALPIITDHRDFTIEAQIGSGSTKAENNTIIVDGVIAPGTKNGDHIIALGKSGARIQASVGGPADTYEEVQSGQTVTVNGKQISGPVYVARGFEILETSLVVNGADRDTEVSIAARRAAQGGARNMNFEAWVKALGLDPTKLDEIQESDLRAAYNNRHGGGGQGGGAATMPATVTAERQRVAAIEAACAGDWGGAADQVGYLRGQAIRGEISYGDLLSGLRDSHALRDLINSRRATDGIVFGGQRGHGAPNKEVLLAGLFRIAGEHSMGEKVCGAAAMNAAESAGFESVSDIAAACLRMEGRDVPSGHAARIKAGFSTISLPILIGGGLERTMAKRFEDHPASWRSFTAKRPLKDFKPVTHARANYSAKLIEIGASGEVKHAKLDEQEIGTLRNRTFARQYRLTRQMLINDDLGVFGDISTVLTAAAVQTHADLVYATLKSGIGTHWTSGRGNLLTGGSSAFDIDSLAEAVKKMRLMTDANGSSINVAPTVLLVGPSLEKEARAVLQSLEVGRTDGGPTGNALRDIVALAVEPRLEQSYIFGGSASTTRWFLFGSPATEPVIQTTLNGVESPIVETLGPEHDPDTLGVTFRIYADFGYSLGEYRASLMSDGA